MKINLDELKRITERIFKQLKENGVNDIELSQDYYWFVPSDEVYDFTKEPSQLTMGQLTDDMKNLMHLTKEDEGFIAYDMVWLAQIMRYIGEKLSSE